MAAGQIDIQMHAACNERGHAGAMRTIPEADALERARQTSLLASRQSSATPRGSLTNAFSCCPLRPCSCGTRRRCEMVSSLFPPLVLGCMCSCNPTRPAPMSGERLQGSVKLRSKLLWGPPRSRGGGAKIACRHALAILGCKPLTAADAARKSRERALSAWAETRERGSVRFCA
jgi:hypothetical protein